MRKLVLLFTVMSVIVTTGFSMVPRSEVGDEKIPDPPVITNNPELLLQTPLPSPASGGSNEPMPGSQALDGIEVVFPESYRAPAMGGVKPHRIAIGVTTSQEQSPKVAYCGNNQYISVFEKDGNIFGQRITSTGALVGAAFRINENDFNLGRASHPDVACQWIRNRIVVTWMYDFNGNGTDYDIHAQGVLGIHQSSGDQLEGNMLVVADSYTHESNPSIACNQTSDFTCLVAYEYAGSGGGDILGKLILVGTPNLSFAEVAAISIGGFGVAEADPDVAWGVDNQDFVIAWQYQEGTGKYSVIYAVLEDIDVVGDQVRKGGTYLIGPGADQVDPAIAYNPEDNTFLLTMTFVGTSSTIIMGRFMSGDGLAVPFPNWYVGTGIYSSVAWFGGAEAFTGAMGGNKFGTTYLAYSGPSDYTIMGVTSGSTYDTYGDYWTQPAMLDHVNLSGWSLDAPDICGNSDTGRALVAWQINEGGTSPDKDVYGMLVAPFTTYLPRIKK